MVSPAIFDDGYQFEKGRKQGKISSLPGFPSARLSRVLREPTIPYGRIFGAGLKVGQTEKR